MGKLIVVKDDKVEGKDKHNVAGSGQVGNTVSPASWIADFDYKGKMTDALSDFVNADGSAAATIDSKSSLNPGETAPGGGHFADSGSNFLPPSPTTVPGTLSITDTIGEGKPSASAGSAFAKIGGARILLDGDPIDTCDGVGIPMNSTVTAANQSFVSCSE